MCGDPNFNAGTDAREADSELRPRRWHTHSRNWFNPCAFAHGSCRRTWESLRARPSTVRDFVNTDFSVIKNFLLPFREGMGVQFRAEFFNLFNHPAILPGGPEAAAMQDVNRSPLSELSTEL